MAVCPKCGKDLVPSEPDGSPLLDDYIHMECKSCGDKVRYTVLKSHTTNAPVSTKNVQQPKSRKKLFRFYLPMVIIIITFGLAIANMQGWISLPNLGGSTGGSTIVGSWVAGSTTLTFTSNGTYTETLNGGTFDTGTYTTSGGVCTMVSNGGHTGSGNYSVSGNILTGFKDAYGNLVPYTRFNP